MPCNNAQNHSRRGGELKMKATIVCLADDKLSNLGSLLLLKANEISSVGYEMTRLPFHVSLKQPFEVKNLKTAEDFFDEFAKSFRLIEFTFEKLSVFRSRLGGLDTGGISISIYNDQLKKLQDELFTELKNKIGQCPAEHDSDYIFHMTIAIGKENYENYEKAYETMKNQIPKDKFVLYKLALFIYTDDKIIPGTYFCYKISDGLK